MPYFVVINNGYQTTDIGVFSGAQDVIEIVTEHNHNLSKNLILIIENLLKTAEIDWQKLDFAAANIGPAPFNSLRVSLSTLNGITFAANTKLIGVNGIECLFEDGYQEDQENIALLNAFAQEVYWARKINGQIKSGIQKLNQFLEKLEPNKKIHFFGQGSKIFKNEIIEKLNNQAVFGQVELPSIKTIASKAFEHFNQNKFQDLLQPVYYRNYL